MMKMIRRVFFLALFAAAPLLAATNEVLVGGTAPAPAPNWRGEPAAASNGDHFFVVWSDARSGSQAIVGTRVTRTSQVLDPLGIRLADFGAGPQVVWDGGAYLIVWSAGRPDVYAARIDAGGRMVMAPRVIVERAIAHGVASNGIVSIVVSSEYPGPSVRTLVLERDGVPVAQETLPIVQHYRSDFTVAAAGSGFVAAWSASTSTDSRFDRIQAVTLDAGGRIDGTVVDIGNGIAPSIASSGTRVMIAWHRFTMTIPGGGHVVQTRALDMKLSNAGDEQTLGAASIFGPPTVLWHGDHFAVVTSHRENEHFFTPTEVRAIELDEDGRATGSRTIGASDPYLSGNFAAATNGAEMLVATIGSPSGGALTSHVVARVVRGQDAGAPVLLSWSGNAHRNPSLASSPSGHIVAWTEDAGVYATRLDANGNSLDGRGVRFSTSAGRARVAFNGTHYVVAWQHEDRIGVRWISPLSGLTIAAAEVPLVELEIDPAFARVGLALATSPQATYVVTAQDRIRVTRIPHTTYTPDAAPLAVSPEDMQVEFPAAAWNGSTLLVVWNERSVANGSPPIPIFPRIYAARLSAGLTLLDPAPLLVAASEDEENPWSFSAPSVASNGTDWLVVAHRGSYETDVVARRVLQNGTLEGSGPATLARGEMPAVAWNGEHYVLAWQREVEGERLRHLFAAAVPSTGALVATKGTLVTTRTAFSAPSLTATTVAYTKYSFRPEHTGVERTFLSNIELDGKRGRVIRR